MKIIKADKKDFAEWLRMAKLLWPKHAEDELRKEFERNMNSEECAIFIFEDHAGKHIAFLNVSLRHEHVSGTNSSPVGYLEGLFVDKSYRNKGIASQLIATGEEWAKTKGCHEMGSDTWDWNIDSIKFHEKLGYKRIETLVHFAKKI